MSENQIVEVLQQGLQDEMNSAFQYIALAGKHGDINMKQDFLHYAADELKHAQKLMELLHQQQAEISDIPIVLEEMDDLYLYLIEYMAREESAVFYYEALEKLMQEPEVQRLCKEIQGEEQLHFHEIKEIFQRVKEGRSYDREK